MYHVLLFQSFTITNTFQKIFCPDMDAATQFWLCSTSGNWQLEICFRTTPKRNRKELCAPTFIKLILQNVFWKLKNIKTAWKTPIIITN